MQLNKLGLGVVLVNIVIFLPENLFSNRVSRDQESGAGICVFSPLLYLLLTGLTSGRTGGMEKVRMVFRLSAKKREDFKREGRENERKTVVTRNG